LPKEIRREIRTEILEKTSRKQSTTCLPKQPSTKTTSPPKNKRRKLGNAVKDGNVTLTQQWGIKKPEIEEELDIFGIDKDIIAALPEGKLTTC
jgi:hypothetical protein